MLLLVFFVEFLKVKNREFSIQNDKWNHQKKNEYEINDSKKLYRTEIIRALFVFGTRNLIKLLFFTIFAGIKN